MDINVVPLEALVTLPGIGNVTATASIEARERLGRSLTLHELGWSAMWRRTRGMVW